MTNLTGRPIYQKGQSKPKKASKPMRKVSEKKAAYRASAEGKSGLSCKRSKSTKLRKSAKGEACTLRIPGVCNGNPETTVLCHISIPGMSGMAMKPIDMHGLYGCSECHRHLDDRSSWNRIELSWFHVLRALFETQLRMVEKGEIFHK